MRRIVQSEVLDGLLPDDPRAVRARQDLRRVNGWMRQHTLMADALLESTGGSAPGQIAELGAGDGHFLLQIASRMAPHWPVMTATLVDRQKSVMPATLTAFAALGWHAEAVVADAFDWLSTPQDGGIVVSNLFLHHFEAVRLATLLRLISRRAKWFVAVEPRRAPIPLFFSRLLWAIGCGEVTRHDAVTSVRAGFSGHELSELWPERHGWHLAEGRAGLFSHLFVARAIG